MFHLAVCRVALRIMKTNHMYLVYKTFWWYFGKLIISYIHSDIIWPLSKEFWPENQQKYTFGFDVLFYQWKVFFVSIVNPTSVQPSHSTICGHPRTFKLIDGLIRKQKFHRQMAQSWIVCFENWADLLPICSFMTHFMYFL